MKDMDVSVVIPVYNSYYSIEEVVNRTTQTLKKLQVSFEVILVDDLSQDDSLSKLNELSKKDKRVNVISLQKNHGQQGAIQVGINTAKGNLIITMDDDLEHQPEDMILLMSEINKGYDVVYAIPQNKRYPFYRKVGSRLVDWFFTLYLSKPSDVKVSSYRIMNRKIAEQIKKDNTSFIYITAMILKVTKNIGNVQCKHVERKYGDSNYNIIKLCKLFIKLFYYYK